MKYDVRMAAIKDIPFIARLMSDFIERPDRLEEIIETLMSKELYIIVAIQIKNNKEKVIGAITFRIVDELSKGLSVMDTTMYIDPEYRGKGLFSKMIGFAEGVAKENKVKNVYVATTLNSLFERKGYKKIYDLYKKEL